MKSSQAQGDDSWMDNPEMLPRIRMLSVAFLVIIVIVSILKFTGVLDGSMPFGGDEPEDDNKLQVSDGGLTVRACNIVETKCPGNKNCRGSHGQVTGAQAIDPDGSKCCMFGCEDQYLEVRACHSYEKMCGQGQACKMGNTLQMPEAITGGGRSCCRFACDEGDIPERAPFSSETVCPTGSYCRDFEGKVTAPTARMSNGNSICPYTQGDDPCVNES